MPITPKQYENHLRAKFNFEALFNEIDDKIRSTPSNDLNKVLVYIDWQQPWVLEEIRNAYLKAGWKKVTVTADHGDSRDAASATIELVTT